jgi:hypothetical protein
MPRVEYMDRNVDLALDSFLMTSAVDGCRGTSASSSLAPDYVELQNWNEVRLDDGSNAQALARTRKTARAIGYYLRSKAFLTCMLGRRTPENCL